MKARKIVSLSLTLFFLLPLCLGSISTYGVEPYSSGDVNGDGKVDLQDIFMARDAIFGAELFPEAFTAADLNRDGVIDVSDILGICDIIFGTDQYALSPIVPNLKLVLPTNQPQLPNDGLEPEYSIIRACWESYSIDEVMEKTCKNYIGRVTGISFTLIDIHTGYAPTEKSDESDIFIHTIYEIEVLISYKGNNKIHEKIEIQGGIPGEYVTEQLEVLRDAPESRRRISQFWSPLNLGEIYLFNLWQYKEEFTPTPLTPMQGIYTLQNPFESEEAKNNNISAKDMISAFGQDKWEEFWNQWKQDNPEYLALLDQAEVEAATP